jgi:hypothetical protein
MTARGELFDDTFAYSKRYDRYDFPDYCLVAIVGGDGPLRGELSGWLEFFVAISYQDRGFFILTERALFMLRCIYCAVQIFFPGAYLLPQHCPICLAHLHNH